MQSGLFIPILLSETSFFATVVKAFEDVIGQVVGFMDNFIGALVIFLIGWLFAKLLSSFIGKILKRVGLDKLAEKLNTTEMFRDAGIRINPIKIIQLFVYWIIMLTVILSATEVLGLGIVSQQISDLVGYLPRLFTAMIILIAGFYLSNGIKNFVDTSCKAYGLPSGKAISLIVFYILFISIAITALNQAEIDTTILSGNILLIMGGIVLAFAIAYGFAARNVLSSLLTSFYSRGNYQLGQEIEIGKYRGEIVEMGSVSFTLDTGDTHIILPLNRLLNEEVVIFQNK